MTERINLKETGELVGGYYNFDLEKCIEDINYNSTFPEDLCEERISWEELKDQLIVAQEVVIDLLNVIKKLKK